MPTFQHLHKQDYEDSDINSGTLGAAAKAFRIRRLGSSASACGLRPSATPSSVYGARSSRLTGAQWLVYVYRAEDMTDFDQFDRVNVADAPEHAAAQVLNISPDDHQLLGGRHRGHYEIRFPLQRSFDGNPTKSFNGLVCVCTLEEVFCVLFADRSELQCQGWECVFISISRLSMKEETADYKNTTHDRMV